MKQVIFILISFLPLKALCQEPEKPINILFDHNDTSCFVIPSKVYDENQEVKKYRKFRNTRNGKIDFIIRNEHFHFDPKINLIDTVFNLFRSKTTFCSIDDLKEIKEKRKQESIHKSEQDGKVKIITNSDFDNIYLFEKSNEEKYIKYKVIWVEELE